MSTIEKAAARLAAKSTSAKAKTRNGDSTADGSGVKPNADTEQDAVRPIEAARPERRLRQATPERAFCDIDVDAVRDRGFITPDVGRSQLAQEMRRIKRPLLLNIQRARAAQEAGPPRNLIMVTSALPGEGKTFISINLAMSIAAEVDRRVLLVDADVARGDVSRQLGLDTSLRGLSDLLQESSYLSEDGVLASNVDRFSILPAGDPTDHVDELFASGMMAVVTQALADADPERVVIFDASPLLATTEAAVLARRMGQTVVVVEANKTPQDAVKQALVHLDGCDNVSLVLNKTTGGAGGGYSYGYGYGYGEGERQPREEAEG